MCQQVNAPFSKLCQCWHSDMTGRVILMQQEQPISLIVPDPQVGPLLPDCFFHPGQGFTVVLPSDCCTLSHELHVNDALEIKTKQSALSCVDLSCVWPFAVLPHLVKSKQKTGVWFLVQKSQSKSHLWSNLTQKLSRVGPHQCKVLFTQASSEILLFISQKMGYQAHTPPSHAQILLHYVPHCPP